jgi:hypothetical protein
MERQLFAVLREVLTTIVGQRRMMRKEAIYSLSFRFVLRETSLY